MGSTIFNFIFFIISCFGVVWGTIIFVKEWKEEKFTLNTIMCLCTALVSATMLFSLIYDIKEIKAKDSEMPERLSLISYSDNSYYIETEEEGIIIQSEEKGIVYLNDYDFSYDIDSDSSPYIEKKSNGFWGCDYILHLPKEN